MNKWSKEKVISIVFIFFIFIMVLGMFFNGEDIYLTMVDGFKSYLPENPTYSDILKTSISRTEDTINNSALFRNKFIDLNGFIQNFIGRDVVEDVDASNTVYKLKNGQLSFSYPEYDTAYCSENLIELYEYLNAKDVNFLYVQAPFKVDKYNNNLPKGYEDLTNKNADVFLNAIDDKVPYLDLRESFKNLKIEHEDLFYNTDHHWKTEAAFEASRETMNSLHKLYNIAIDNEILDKKNYNFEEYKNFFLGSQGRRVGKYYGGIDDYTLITPKFHTDYTVKIKEYTKNGAFKDTILEPEFLKTDLPVDTNRYASYFGGDYEMVKVDNNNVDTGKTLIIQDSFGLPFSAFMSLNFKETHTMDLRHFREESLVEYLEENHYDNVLFLYNPSVFEKKIHEYQFIFK